MKKLMTWMEWIDYRGRVNWFEITIDVITIVAILTVAILFSI